MSLIKDNKLVEVVSILTTIDKVIVKEFNNPYPNSGYKLVELPIVLDDSSKEELSLVFKVVGERCLKASGSAIDVTEYVSWCNEGEEGYEYLYRFYVNKDQMNIILLEYREFAAGLFEGIVNPIIPIDEGYMIYVNTFAEGVEDMLVTGGIKIEANPNIV